MKESEIEARLVRMVRGLGGLCLKFVSPGCAGVPDRIIILPGGRVIFVELKTEFGQLRNLQRYYIDELRARGADVRVLRGLDQVNEFITEVKGVASEKGT